MTEMEIEELRAEATRKYDHPTKPTPMIMNPRGVLALIERGDRLADALEAIAVLRWPALTRALTEMSENVEREAGAALRAVGRLP